MSTEEIEIVVNVHKNFKEFINISDDGYNYLKDKYKL